MPTKVLALHVPADVLEKIDDLSRSQCLSRSAAVRLILINEIQRRRLEAGDAFVIPPAMATRYAQASADLMLMEVSLPGNPPTEIL